MKNKMLALIGLALGIASGAFVGGVQALVVAVGALCFFDGLSSGHSQQHHAHNK